MSMTEDQGFKILLGRYPGEALELFAPETLADHGPPSVAILLATEVPPLAADSSHRLMDLAVRFTWPDGRALVVVLLEHWSASCRIDLARVLRYVAELTLRHPGLAILPIILVTDDGPPPADLRLIHRTSTWEALRLTPRCIHLRRPGAIPPGLLANHVAVMLAALVPTADRIALVAEVAGRYVRMPGGVDDLRTLLPLILLLAKLRSQAEIAATYQRLRQDHAMLDINDFIRAEGKAEGKAEALVAIIRLQVTRGRLTIDEAHDEIAALEANGNLTRHEADLARTRLG